MGCINVKVEGKPSVRVKSLSIDRLNNQTNSAESIYNMPSLTSNKLNVIDPQPTVSFFENVKSFSEKGNRNSNNSTRGLMYAEILRQAQKSILATEDDEDDPVSSKKELEQISSNDTGFKFMKEPPVDAFKKQNTLTSEIIPEAEETGLMWNTTSLFKVKVELVKKSKVRCIYKVSGAYG